MFRLTAFFALFACLFPVLAQNAPTVTSVDIQYIGPKAVSEQMVRSHIRTAPGATFSRAAVDEDVRNLYATGFFYNIQVVDKPAENGVALTYLIQGKPRLTAIKFSGNKKFSNSKLRKKISSKEGQPLDEHKLFSDVQEIRKTYEKSGFPQTEVKYALSIDEGAGTGTATFEIKESPKVKIEDVDFVGNEAFKEKKLRKVIKTRKRWMFSWITGSGVLKQDQIQEDRERLAQFYQRNGYIDFEIKDIQTEYITPTKLRVRLVIFEGKPYKVGNITITGETLFPTNAIYAALPMKVGDTFTPAGLATNNVAIENFYGSKGYIDVQAGSRQMQITKIPNTAKGTMDLQYTINAGQKSYIERIEIQGNTKTKDRVIRRELAVVPGETFDMTRVKLSETRLMGLQYFESINTQPTATDVPTRKNLEIDVEEKNTGNLSLGAGFSSVDSVVGFVEVSQGNFDLFNPPTFTGGGQKFRLRMQIGNKRQDYLLSFIEPWFLGRKLALGVDLYHRDLDFVSVEELYNESRTGAKVSLTRALWGDNLIGSVSYTFEQVGILDVKDTTTNIVAATTNTPAHTNISIGAPPTIHAEEGHTLISKVGFSLAYDTRRYDHKYSGFIPNGGQRTELSADIAASQIGSEQDFYKIDLHTAWYFKGFFTGHILEVVGRGGVAESFGGTRDVPFYERWYLGGLYSLRGYKYRDISPRESGYDEPIGGDTYWFGSAEYSIPIIERLRFALFYDIGNVRSDAYDFNFSEYADNWGLGLRLNLPIGPLRLDYGIPLSHPDDVSGSGRFQFGVGYTREF